MKLLGDGEDTIAHLLLARRARFVSHQPPNHILGGPML